MSWNWESFIRWLKRQRVEAVAAVVRLRVISRSARGLPDHVNLPGGERVRVEQWLEPLADSTSGRKLMFLGELERPSHSGGIVNQVLGSLEGGVVELLSSIGTNSGSSAAIAQSDLAQPSVNPGTHNIGHILDARSEFRVIEIYHAGEVTQLVAFASVPEQQIWGVSSPAAILDGFRKLQTEDPISSGQPQSTSWNRPPQRLSPPPKVVPVKAIDILGPTVSFASELSRVRPFLARLLSAPPVHVHLDFQRAGKASFSYSEQPFLSRLTVSNGSPFRIDNLTLRIILPGFGRSNRMPIKRLEPREVLRVDKSDQLPRFQFYPDKLLYLPCRTPTPPLVKADQWSVPCTTEGLVEMLPRDFWYCVDKDPALAAFVVPDHWLVHRIVRDASFRLADLSQGAEAFADVLPNELEAVLQAFWLCLRQDYSIRYEDESSNSFANWQAVRSHEKVRQWLEATCIDAAVLLAACLAHVHRDPLIILINVGQDPCSGLPILHALVGCWRRSSPLRDQPIIESDAKLHNWIRDEQICLVDPTTFLRSKTNPRAKGFEDFQMATVEETLRLLRDRQLHFALDIAAARLAGITPMSY